MEGARLWGNPRSQPEIGVFAMHVRHLCCAATAILAILATTADAAGDDVDLWPHVQVLFPDADAMGALEGNPPVARVTLGKQTLGFVFLTDLIYPIPAYSGKPISSLVGVAPDGTLKGVRIVHHVEPILLAGVSEEDLADFVSQYAGLSAKEDVRIEGIDAEGRQIIDSITGATITVMVINASVVRSLAKVLPAAGIR